MNSCEIICFRHLPHFFNFSTRKRFKKTQGTHILDRLEILYRIGYENQNQKIFTLFLLSVHLTLIRISNFFGNRISAVGDHKQRVAAGNAHYMQ